jgi:hypothetical protein
MLRRKHEDAHGDYEKKVKSLESEIKWARTQGDKRELFGAAAAQRSPEEEGDGMLRDASQVQDKTEQSLAHTKAVVEATKEVRSGGGGGGGTGRAERTVGGRRGGRSAAKSGRVRAKSERVREAERPGPRARGRDRGSSAGPSEGPRRASERGGAAEPRALRCYL